MDKLAHLYWLGGGPCAGKTTVSDVIAAKKNVGVHHVDQHRAEIHVGADTDRYPSTAQFVSEMRAVGSGAFFTRELSLPPQKSFSKWKDYFREETELAVEVLKTLPANRPFIVDSTHALPEFIRDLASPDHACFLVATDEVIRRHNRKRHAAGPQVGFTWPEELIEKQEQSFSYRTHVIKKSALELGYAVVEVDDSLGPEEVADRVIECFGL